MDMTKDTTDPVRKSVLAATATLFNGCDTQRQLAAALIVVLRGPLWPDVTLIRNLHTEACVRKGWEPS